MALLSPEDRARVEATVSQAEQGTAGEVVVVVVPRCDDYAVWRGMAAFALAVLGGALLYEFAWFVPGIWAFLVQIPLFVAAFWGLGFGAPTRWLVPGRVRAACVSDRAKQIFVERGLTETRERSGVLFLLAELEHRVEILADAGIHERVGVPGWQGHVDRVVRAIHEGRAADGLCAAIEAVGKELAEAFPRREGDVNELPNAVVVMTQRD